MIGRYDGLHGDEDECRGFCGLCEDCEGAYNERSDYAYEAWHEEQINLW